jgi:hypothetical protein
MRADGTPAARIVSGYWCVGFRREMLSATDVWRCGLREPNAAANAGEVYGLAGAGCAVGGKMPLSRR